MAEEATDRPGVGCVDALTEALGASGSDDVAAALVRCRRPWGFRLDVTRSVALVAVTQGACWLRQPAAPPLRLASGNVALVPVTRPGHGLASAPSGELAPFDTTFSRSAAVLDLAGNGSASSLVYVAYEPASPTHRFHPGLPGVLVVGKVAPATVQLLSEELLHNHPGSRTAMRRLVDVLVIHTVRVWMAEDFPGGTQGSPAPIDEAVAVALDRIHTEPARPWTVGTLATETGLSRAAFVRRFTAVVGEPLFSYLTSWRLATAARCLRDGAEPLATIARRVGYSSEFTFSRAFNRAYGQPPGRYRTAMSRRAKD